MALWRSCSLYGLYGSLCQAQGLYPGERKRVRPFRNGSAGRTCLGNLSAAALLQPGFPEGLKVTLSLLPSSSPLDARAGCPNHFHCCTPKFKIAMLLWHSALQDRRPLLAAHHALFGRLTADQQSKGNVICHGSHTRTVQASVRLSGDSVAL